MRRAILSCPVLEDEVRAAIEASGAVARLTILDQRLHETPALLKEDLSRRIAAIEAEGWAEAIVLMLGLCGTATVGLRSFLPIALPRVDDCIGLLLGSSDRHRAHLAAHPGTYWYTPGWVRAYDRLPGPERSAALRRELAQRYGEEEAALLQEELEGWARSYRIASHLHVGVGDLAVSRAAAIAAARHYGWEHDEVEGDASLIHALVAGCWQDDRIVVIPPGGTIRACGDGRVMAIEAPPGRSGA